MSEEYDIEKSKSKVGELYPVLLAADGTVIDGNHRGKGWKTEVLEHIDTEEKKILARTISNWHRRVIPRKEKEFWINSLAKIYQEQGYQVSAHNPSGQYRNEIKDKIIEETGLSENTVLNYLSKEFKQQKDIPPKAEHRVPASQRIETTLGSEYVERHKEEVKEELREELEQEIKEEIGFKYDIPELLEEPEPKQMDEQEIKEIGSKIGKDIKEAMYELHEDIQRAQPKIELENNTSNMKWILRKIDRGTLYNPFDKDAVLVWSTGHTLEETIAEMEKRIKNA